ncbi:MAG: BatD family protein [Candidatus Binatia bacterium]
MVTTRHRLRTPRARRLTPLAAALCLSSVLPVGAALAATGSFEASVTPKVVVEGDPVRLTLRFSGDAPAARPDLSPLEKDFEVLGSQQSQRVSIVDGDVEQTRELEILLSPKHGGDLEIPALHAGDLATEPLRLTVRGGGTGNTPASPSASNGTSGATDSSDVAARVARNGEMPGLFVDAQVDQAKPFVQGEVRYTVRVYDALGIREGALTEPAAKGVRIEPRGDTRTFEEVVGGRRYMVHEREFAAFPQSSGEVVIPPVVLQARVADEPGRGRRSAFEEMFGDDDEMAQMFAQMQRGFGGSILDRMMGSGREVRVRSNPVTLNVQGRPGEAAQGWFLPATSVTLTQSWSPAHPAFRVGESVKRTVTLRADGASATQLPEIAAGDAGGVKQYAAKPETRATANGAELVQSFDVLPTTAGTLTLPRIEVPWWDTASNTQRTAVLPEETIEILPADGSAPLQAAQAPAPAPAKGASAASAAAQAKSAGTTSAGATTHVPSANEPAAASAATEGGTADFRTFVSSHPAPSAGAAAALIALLGTSAWLVARRRRDGQIHGTANAGHMAPTAAGGTGRVPARALVDAVHQACAANDARAVRDALVAWGRAAWSDAPPASAAAVARRTGDASFVRAVKSLDDSLYAPQAAPFDGTAFRRAFDAARRASTSGGVDAPEVLPALYPESRLA